MPRARRPRRNPQANRHHQYCKSKRLEIKQFITGNRVRAGAGPESAGGAATAARPAAGRRRLAGFVAGDVAAAAGNADFGYNRISFEAGRARG